MVMKRNLSSQGITFLQKSVRELIAAVANIGPKHEKETIALVNSYKKLYPQWVFELRCGFGLLMYGFGSKKALIESFASTALAEYPVIVINGYLQLINLKQLKTRQRTSSGILPKVQQPFNSRSLDDLLAFLDKSEAEENDSFICVVIHNIDGPGLRDSESQQYLARIASCSNIRTIANTSL
ncbi:origin of replication complex subunit 2 isoform X2 [Hevea brasiliensis]|uniref:origin of replication complex subunit 2 isoform X2 n=1 Tax=Hevea brasiliensis TaxID=3981 RepID=UPI0026007827|nr:origin of replication complex subunit 2 isoform X2 [Hevea brasiliensis]